MRAIILSMVCLVFLTAGETVTDASTGLVWQDNSDAKSVRKDADGAKAYCEALELEGMKGWRLPDVKELQSIIDITRQKQLIKQDFTQVDTIGFYWSATPYAPEAGYEWTVNFYNGNTEKGDKTKKGFIRCVRVK